MMIYTINTVYFFGGGHVSWTYDKNNENLETITNKFKYTFDKIEGILH